MTNLQASARDRAIVFALVGAALGAAVAWPLLAAGVIAPKVAAPATVGLAFAFLAAFMIAGIVRLTEWLVALFRRGKRVPLDGALPTSQQPWTPSRGHAL